MKRYLLFSCYDYYPNGGWHDFISDFDSIDAAQDALKKEEHTFKEWSAHIVDSNTKEIVAEASFGSYGSWIWDVLVDRELVTQLPIDN